MAGWNADVGAQGIGGGPEVTLVDGSTFAVSDASGDINGGVHGLYLFDTRMLSQFVLRVAKHAVEALSVEYLGPFSATFISRLRPVDGPIDAPIVVLRTRSVGNGMSESIELRNYATTAAALDLELAVGVDFASVFDVKAGRVVQQGRSTSGRGPGLSFVQQMPSGPWIVTVKAASDTHCAPATLAALPPGTDETMLCWRVEIDPGGRWTACVELALQTGARVIELAHPCGVPIERAVHATRLASWRSSLPAFSSNDPTLETAVARAQEDLGALRVFDPDHADRVVVAAGAPWYMTLFGRDSLLAAWMALLTQQELAVGVLQALADLQGDSINPLTEEEPGRIVHEVRYDQQTSRMLGGRNAYYGTVDATPLFVMLVGELARWGVARERVAQFLPHVDRALAWIDQFGDRDGDGYIEYLAATETGLRNQGWKDSWDAIRYRNGDIATAPLALAEVQGYVYAAYVARAELAELFENPDAVRHWQARAAALKQRFNRDFWVEELGWYAMALDAEKQPVDALASNIGHCLWTGVVDTERAEAIAARLASPQLSSGYGLRTLASSTPGFNPLSYHCGSVWPHDTAIAVAGLFRYGCDSAASVLARGLLDASRWHNGRLPELFGGFDRNEFDRPVRYPASCSPQAWASAAPLLLVRSMLGLEPRVQDGVVQVRHAHVEGIERLRLDGVRLAGNQVSIIAEHGTVRIEGLPEGLRVQQR